MTGRSDHQVLKSNPPGTLDTSFIAMDYLNNPGTSPSSRACASRPVDARRPAGRHARAIGATRDAHPDRCDPDE